MFSMVILLLFGLKSQKPPFLISAVIALRAASTYVKTLQFVHTTVKNAQMPRIVPCVVKLGGYWIKEKLPLLIYKPLLDLPYWSEE